MKRSPFLDSPRWLNGAIAIIQNQNLKNRESSVTWTSPLFTFVLFEPNLEWKQNSFAGPLSETFEKRAPGPHYYCYRMHVSPSSGRLGTDRGEICRGSGTKYHHQCQTPCRPLVAQGPLTKKVRPGMLLMRACSYAILIITPLFRNATCRSTDNFVHCRFWRVYRAYKQRGVIFSIFGANTTPFNFDAVPWQPLWYVLSIQACKVSCYCLYHYA